MIDYRQMTQADVVAGLALCRSAGWNQLAFDWKLFLDSKPMGALVATESGKVVGTVATIDYEDCFSWVGMVLVDPEKKRQGIGTELLTRALAGFREDQTVKLDATPAGRNVYLKLGFQDEYVLSRMLLTSNCQPGNTKGRRMEAYDLQKILPTDEKVFGAPRPFLLKALFNEYPDHAFINNEASGYSFGRKGHLFTQVGPVIANTMNDAVDVTITALKNLNGPIVMDAIDGSPFQRWMTSMGFVEQRKLIRMYRGNNNHPGEPDRQFAILGPEFG